MILQYLKEFTELLLDEYAKEVLKRPLKKYERDIFYLKYEYYVNRAVQNAKDSISSYIRDYITLVMKNEISSD